jgi:hypothetical protein
MNIHKCADVTNITISPCEYYETFGLVYKNIDFLIITFIILMCVRFWYMHKND